MNGKGYYCVVITESTGMEISTKKTKISLIIIFISLVVTLLYLKNTIDPFAPIHASVMQQIINSGFLPYPSFTDYIPLFYITGVEVSFLFGLETQYLSYFPYQLLPFVAISYILFKKLTDDLLVTSIVIGIILFSSTIGSSYYFLWPHGLGLIFMLTILYLIITYFNKINFQFLFVLMLLIITTLIFTSYNYAFQTILLLFIFFIIIKTMKGRVIEFDSKKAGSLFTVLLITVVIQMGLSLFFYDRFLPSMTYSFNMETDTLSKLLSSYFYKTSADIEISSILIQYPVITTGLTLVKYIIIVTVILYFIIYYVGQKKVCIPQIAVLSIILVIPVYALMRWQLGELIVPLLFIPGLLCLSILYREHKKIIAITLIILLSTSMISFYVNVSSDNAFSFDIDNREQSVSTWLLKHSNDEVVISDIYTRSTILMYQSKFLNISEYDEQKFNVVVFNKNQILNFINQRDDGKNQTLIVTNDNNNVINLYTWYRIKSYRDLNDCYFYNYNNQMIYSNSIMSVYKTCV